MNRIPLLPSAGRIAMPVPNRAQARIFLFFLIFFDERQVLQGRH
jgi:hypothetical protein